MSERPVDREFKSHQPHIFLDTFLSGFSFNKRFPACSSFSFPNLVIRGKWQDLMISRQYEDHTRTSG